MDTLRPNLDGEVWRAERERLANRLNGGAGSYALGGVHNAVRLDLLRADAEQLAATMTRQLVEPMSRFNFGPEVAAPRWCFEVEPPRDELRDAQTQTARAEVFKRALDLGLQVSRAQAYAELRLQEPTGGEDLFGADELPTDTTEDTAENA